MQDAQDRGPSAGPKPISAFWGVTASASALVLSLYLWATYPKGYVIYGANTILYACVLAYWVNKRKQRHLSARVIASEPADRAESSRHSA